HRPARQWQPRRGHFLRAGHRRPVSRNRFTMANPNPRSCYILMKKLLFLLLLVPFLGTAQTTISNNLAVSAPKALDSRTGKFVSGAWIPWASTTEANAGIPSSRRYVGLTVCIGTSTVCTEYWYSGGI